MNQVEELITKLCPKGVEHHPITDVFEVRNGYTPSKAKAEYWDNGDIPWIRLEDIRTFGRVLDRATQYIHESGVRPSGAFQANSIIISTLATIGEHALVTVPFVANQQITILTINESFSKNLDPKFAFYYCFNLAEYCRAHTSTSGFASVNMRDFKKFSFPVPPLEVQLEVARILDAFTGLEAELEAELEARLKQRLQVIDWLHAGKLPQLEDAIEVPLSELVYFENGKPHEPLVDPLGDCELITAKFIASNGTLARRINYDDIRTSAHLGDITIVLSDLPNGRALAKCYFVQRDDYYAVNQRIAILRSKDAAIANPEYLYHYVSRNPQILKFDDGSTQTHLKKANVVDMIVRLPPLEIQDQIARALTALEKFVFEATEGLPAEIEARRKQHEYYRSKLLSFKELEVA